ncbi:hypothetical protein BDP27DRAFT_1427097 [Rhodocollybia butyracea]|uniref:Uncharacterized protein n=1 Tax=Rhodocollybia butyracea TaxID=206335 RepID=A0A9P5PJI6_9AGAR|nr:hypothetical protein BDP27DRAFT_1427097 [Rhodocollybia butyracea]
MRSALLLALIASSMLVVFSQPVKREAHTLPVPTMTFLAPETGEARFEAFENEVPNTYSRFINDALNMKGTKWTYEGSFLRDRKFTVLKLTGGPHCPMNVPCYARRARGAVIPGSKRPANPTMMDYIGLTTGLTQANGTAVCAGVFPPKVREHIPSGAEWELLRTEFNEMSIPGVPKTGLLPFTVPFLAVPTVKFLNIADGQPLNPEGHAAPSLKTVMTTRLNEILYLAGPDTVTYHGKPVWPGSEPVYFEYIGGDVRCTFWAPCYGWAGKAAYVKPGHKKTNRRLLYGRRKANITADRGTGIGIYCGISWGFQSGPGGGDAASSLGTSDETV